MNAQHKYTRKGKTITTHSGDTDTLDTHETFPSINAAKRKSRELQGRSGDGSLRVVKTASKLEKKPVLAKKPAAKAAVAHNPRPTAVEQGQQIKIRGKKPVVTTKPKRAEGGV